MSRLGKRAFLLFGILAAAAPGTMGASRPSSPATVAFKQQSRAPSTTVAAATGTFGFTLSSPSMDVANLAYLGIGNVIVDGVTFQALEFTLDTDGMAGMTFVGPCDSGYALQTLVPEGSTATFTGSVALDLTALDFTLDGTTYSFTPAAPPPGGFTLAAATLTGVSMSAVDATADSLTMSGMKTAVVAC